jgi:sporulation protein YlmC with PRC-barrel domain
VDLGREVLDQQLLDARGVQMGKVDGVILELRDGEPPRVAGLVVGGTTLLWRIHRGLARWVERRRGGAGRVARIPWARVVKIGVDVKVDVEAEQSPALHWERWVRERIIRRIPGA